MDFFVGPPLPPIGERAITLPENITPASVFSKKNYIFQTAKKPNKISLFKASFRQFILVQPQKMSQLMQKSCPNFVPKAVSITFRLVHNVFQKQNNLRRHRNAAFFSKFRAGKDSLKDKRGRPN
jgi:hypothetical protein